MFQKKLKQMGAWALALTLAVGAVQFPAAPVKAAESVNIAPNATATASSAETADFTAEKVLDGDKTSKPSRWGSALGEGPEWIQLQWDQAQTIKNVVIYWERRNAENYRLETSDNGEDWTTVWSNESYPSKNNETITLDSAVKASYLRVYIEKVNDQSADPSETAWRTVSMYEIEVFGDEIPDDRTDLEKLVASIQEPVINKGDRKVSMPQGLPTGVTANFYADYEQVIGDDGTIYTPLEDKVIKGFYELSTEDQPSAQTAEYTLTVPGQYESEKDANEKPAVIPELQEWHGKTGIYVAPASAKVIVASPDLMNVANEFKADYEEITGLAVSEIKTGAKADAKAGDFYFALSSGKNGLGKEGYTIDIDNAVSVEAEETTGAYWATRTILQILKQTNGSMPKGLVRDYPKFEVRGFSFDVGRKPFTLDVVGQFAKNMAWYKMNSLQLHLSDNLIFHEDYATIEEAIEKSYAGFRLESGVVNEETGKSATSEDLYYTKDEFRDFIQNSRIMGVDIVPEFDMPAHALPFTRAFPQFMTAKSGGGHAYLIEEIDLSKEGATEWAQSIWNDYFEGDNPVFDKEMTVHIGTDEFHGVDGQPGKEMFRKFSDDMIKFVQGTGRNVRMWGSLSNKSGTTPVASEGVQLNIWNTGYADPKNMYDLGYDLINTLEGPNYIVPAAGYYNNYINAGNIYNTWTPNVIGNLNAKAGDDQILGGCYAIWHDSIDTRANGISQYDSFDRFFKPLPAYSAKLWGEAADRDYKGLTQVAEKTGTAPGTTIYGEVDYATSTVADYNFDGAVAKDASVNGFDLTNVVNAGQVNAGHGKALQLKGGESYAETPQELDLIGDSAVLTMQVKMDADAEGEQILCESKDEFGIYGTYAFKASQKNTGKVGFSREGYDYSFDYELPKEEWHTLTFESGQDSVKLLVDGEVVDENPDIYFANHPTTELTATLAARRITKVDTMLVPFGRIGSKTKSFKGQIDSITVTGTKEPAGDYGMLERDGWTVDACSTHASEGSREAVLDGDNTTYWHQDYASDTAFTDAHPYHWFEITLPAAKEINKLSYLPRQDSQNGRIYEYSIEVTKEDGSKQTVVDHATWASSASVKTATFPTVKAKSVRLLMHKTEGNHATIAELKLYEPVNDALFKTELEQYLKGCEVYQKTDYAEGSWNIFCKAKEEAGQILSHSGSTTEDYQYVYEKLVDAVNGLISMENVDPTVKSRYSLIAAVEDAKKQMQDTEIYTAESVAALEKALASAEEMLEKEDADWNMLNAALLVLQDAKLVTKASVVRTQLEAAITAAKQKLANTAGYTAESVAALQQALKDAEGVLARADASAEELTNAMTVLNSKELVKDTSVAPQPPVTEEPKLQKNQKATVSGVSYKVTNADKKEVTITKGKNIKNVKIGATVVIDGVTCKITQIANNAFKNCKKVKTVVVGNQVTSIGKNAFTGCSSLTTVTIGKNVKTINSKAFYNCKKLKKVILQGKKAPSVKKNAFGKTASKMTVQAKGLSKKARGSFLDKLKKTGGMSKKATIK